MLTARRVAAAALAVAACGGSTAATTAPPANAPAPTVVTSTTAAAPPTTNAEPTTPPATEPPPAPTTSRPLEAREVTLELPAVSQLGAEWVEQFVVPYGDGEDRLGTSPGGEGGSLAIGPDYGAQAPDGTWWFLDLAKFRLAHFAADGSYLDQIVLPPEYLADGRFWPYQLPRVLDDGSLVASWLEPETSKLLVVDGGELELVDVAGQFSPTYDDGTFLYGFSPAGDLLRVDPRTGDTDVVDWLPTRAGSRFLLVARDDRMTLDLPDASPPSTTAMRTVYAGDPSQQVIAGVEVASGEDGSLFVFMYGGTDSGDGGQLGGFLAVAADGAIAPLEPTRDPFSASDPGSPAHLGVRPGTSTPWLLFVDTDGVRVFTRP